MKPLNFFLITVILACAGCFGRRQLMEPKQSGLVFTCSVGEQARLKDSIEFCLTLSNASQKTYYLADYRGFGDCVVKLVDRSQVEIAYTEAGRSAFTRREASSMLYSKVYPGAERAWHYDLKSMFVLKPGIYTINAVVEAGLPGEVVKVSSNPLRITE